jgi:hypothetical protein
VATDPGKQQAEAARQVLREIEKARLRIQAEDSAIPHFPDFMVNSVWMISDLAADAIRRADSAGADNPADG